MTFDQAKKLRDLFITIEKIILSEDSWLVKYELYCVVTYIVISLSSPILILILPVFMMSLVKKLLPIFMRHLKIGWR